MGRFVAAHGCDGSGSTLQNNVQNSPMGVIETRGYRTKCIWLVDGIWAQISAKPLLPIVQLRGGIMRNRVVRFKTEETKKGPPLANL